MRLLSTPKLEDFDSFTCDSQCKGVAYKKSLRDEEAGIVLAGNRGDAAEWDAYHRLAVLEEFLVIEDDALVRDAKESCAAPFKIEHGAYQLTGKAHRFYLVQLVFSVNVYIAGVLRHLEIPPPDRHEMVVGVRSSVNRPHFT